MKSIAIGFIIKIFSFKNGSLALLSYGTSSIVAGYLNVLIENSDQKKILLPIVIHFFGFIFFTLFNLIDLGTGLQASSLENKRKEVPEKNWVKSNKLYRTLWKGLGVITLMTMIAVTGILTEIIQSNYAYWTILWFQVGFWLLACGFEFHSVGENLGRISGTTPKIFTFWDSVLNAMQNKILKKIDNTKIDEDGKI